MRHFWVKHVTVTHTHPLGFDWERVTTIHKDGNGHNTWIPLKTEINLTHEQIFNSRNGKGKVIPLQVRCGPEGG